MGLKMLYSVWCPDRGETEDDASEQLAYSSWEAAESWAREDDACGDYDIVRGTEVDLHVRDPDGDVGIYTVIGESEPVYTAHEKREK